MSRRPCDEGQIVAGNTQSFACSKPYKNGFRYGKTAHDIIMLSKTAYLALNEIGMHSGSGLAQQLVALHLAALVMRQPVQTFLGTAARVAKGRSDLLRKFMIKHINSGAIKTGSA